ncbi:MAG: hypothetical protein IKV85_11170 [Ruminococcus sp.]|nr:hypothetical protein [Ruminococcus sp.]
MKKFIMIIFFILSALSIIGGVARQKEYSENYVRTKATLVFEERKLKLPSTYTYVYKVGDNSYVAIKENGLELSRRNIYYRKDLPSSYRFGYIEVFAKILFFMGIFFALIAVYILAGHILYVSFASKILMCIFLCFTVGMFFLTGSVQFTFALSFGAIVIYACFTELNRSTDYYN